VLGGLASLLIVRPATVLAWHRQGFQLYWRWKSRTNPAGRPKLGAEIRNLIRDRWLGTIPPEGAGASRRNSPSSATASLTRIGTGPERPTQAAHPKGSGLGAETVATPRRCPGLPPC
jgi:hypothetical protein